MKTEIYFANDQVPAQCKLTQQMNSTTGKGAARNKPYALQVVKQFREQETCMHAIEVRTSSTTQCQVGANHA